MKHFTKVLLAFLMFFSNVPLLQASGIQYAGFAESSNGAYLYSKISSGQGVQKYYVVPYDLYTSELSQEQIISASQVAYCFNYHHKYPPCFKEKELLYSLLPNASAEAFENACKEHKRSVSDSLYSNIVRIAHIGYPNNEAGIQEKYGLSDDVFRFLTQYAIWYYTDSLDIRFQDNTYIIYDADTPITKSYEYTERLQEGWLALLETEYDSADTSGIDLFQASESAYQCLLTVASSPHTASLTIHKEIQADVIDETKEFIFHVNLYDASHKPLSGTFPFLKDAEYSSITFTSSEAVFSLSHNETASILGLPENIYYEVREEETEGYTSIIPDNASNTIPLTSLQNECISFINVKDTESSLTIRKSVINDPSDITEFTFQLSLWDAEGTPLTEITDMNDQKITLQEGTYTFSLTAGGSLTFPHLSKGTKYEIKELSKDGYSILSLNPQSSSLQEDTTIIFENRKEEILYEADIHASKILLDGSEPLSLSEKQFRFLLQDTEGQTIEAFNDTEGNIVFPTLQYSKIGQYTYTITEDPSYNMNENITYDTSEKKVIVNAGNEDVITLFQQGSILMKEDALWINDHSLEAFGMDAQDHTDGTYTYDPDPEINQRLVQLLYFQHTHPYGTMIQYHSRNIPFTQSLMEKMVMYLSGTITSQKDYYEELLTNMDETVVDTYDVILFTNNDNDRLIAGFDHSVTIDYETEPVFTNTMKEGELVVRKTVSGIHTDTAFTFVLEILDPEGSPVFTSSSLHKKISENKESTISLNWKEGKTSFTLKEDESIVFSSLPDTFSYTLEELDASQYTVTFPKDPSSQTNIHQADVVVNNEITYSLKLIKINADKERLQGVGFTLNEGETSYTDANGELIFYGLKEGTYSLQEVKALTGYILKEDPVSIIIQKDGTVTIDKENQTISNNEILLTLTNAKEASLPPNLGGSGDMFYYAIALIGMITIVIYFKIQEKIH